MLRAPGGQRGGSEGLLNEQRASCQHHLLDCPAIRVAGHVQHPHARACCPVFDWPDRCLSCAASPRPSVAGQGDLRGGKRSRNASSADSAPSTWYPMCVSMVRVRFRTCGSSSTRRMVSVAGCAAASAPGRTADSGGRRYAGQIDLNDGALARLALNQNLAPVLLDDAVDDGEPQACAFALILGGEERLEQPRLDCRVHADAGVADRAASRSGRPPRRYGESANSSVSSTSAVSIASLPPSGMASRELTARFMMTWSICEGSTFTAGSCRREIDFQLDVFPDDPPQHFVDALHDLVEIHNPGHCHLPAAECQQLVGQRRGSLRRVQYFVARIPGPRRPSERDRAAFRCSPGSPSADC